MCAEFVLTKTLRTHRNMGNMLLHLCGEYIFFIDVRSVSLYTCVLTVYIVSACARAWMELASVFLCACVYVICCGMCMCI